MYSYTSLYIYAYIIIYNIFFYVVYFKTTICRKKMLNQLFANVMMDHCQFLPLWKSFQFQFVHMQTLCNYIQPKLLPAKNWQLHYILVSKNLLIIIHLFLNVIYIILNTNWKTYLLWMRSKYFVKRKLFCKFIMRSFSNDHFFIRWYINNCYRFPDFLSVIYWPTIKQSNINIELHFKTKFCISTS